MRRREKNSYPTDRSETSILFDLPERIAAHDSKSFTVALNKFTIPDKKVLIIEVQELGGGRHFKYKLKNDPIISAEILNPGTRENRVVPKQIFY